MSNVVWVNTTLVCPPGPGACFLQGVYFYLATVYLDGVTITGFGTTGDTCAAGFFFGFSNVTMKNGAVSETVSYTSGYPSGGGLCFTDCPSVFMDNFTIDSNFVPGQIGGGGYIERTNITVSNSRFLNNVGHTGGGVYSYDSNVTFINTIFTNNSAQEGGGLAIEGYYLSLSNCTITSNNATLSGGGGIVAYNGQLYIEKTEISNNHATTIGGAVFFTRSAQYFVAENSTIVNNTATVGQAIFHNSSQDSVVVQNSLIQEGIPEPTQGNYCCGNQSISAPSGLICNFPTCNSTSCQDAAGCTCPYKQESPYTSFSSGNGILCTCDPQYSGQYCTEYHDCNNSCLSTAYCRDFGQGYQCYCQPGYGGPNCTETTGNMCGLVVICTSTETCVNTLGIFTCVCKSGFAGTPPMCTDIDECAANTYNCGNKTCNNTFGSYECICPPGFEGDNCTDINECTATPGICGNKTCNNTFGSFECYCPSGLAGDNCTDERISCPAGYAANSSHLCALLCGDGNCSTDFGETCVSCPFDCKNSTCDACGDGVCDVGETCETCFEDCRKLCSPITCDACSYGNCVGGICVCNPGWSGPACDVQPEPITVTPNTTYPSVTLIKRDVPSKNENDLRKQYPSFGISVYSIGEYSQDGSAVSYFDLRQVSFTYHHPIPENSAANSQWVFISHDLGNKANITITFIAVFDPDGTFFEKYETYSPYNTLKVNVAIYNWPFKAIANTLHVEFRLSVVAFPGGATCADLEINKNGSVQFTEITFYETTIFTRFFPGAIIDSRLRQVSFSALSNFSVTAILPHFWSSAELDPDYAILLGRGCSAKPRNAISKALVIGIVVPILVLILFGAFIFYFWNKRHHRKKKNSKILQEIPFMEENLTPGKKIT
eukprot:Phypoly_transcript_02302.p1 GENE.Phypoly_transcript_02302~~Phypoly_transcript_02302.p1  ORF type:complete len:887 (+),score=74.73 Phypoly_transcript_02302:138-2798(+)